MTERLRKAIAGIVILKGLDAGDASSSVGFHRYAILFGLTVDEMYELAGTWYPAASELAPGRTIEEVMAARNRDVAAAFRGLMYEVILLGGLTHPIVEKLIGAESILAEWKGAGCPADQVRGAWSEAVEYVRDCTGAQHLTPGELIH